MTSHSKHPKDMDLYEIAQRACEKGEEWAQKQADYDHLDRMVKTIHSELSTEYKDDKTSVAMAEKYAYIHPSYVKHLKKLKEARESALASKIHYEKWQNAYQAKMMELSVSKYEKRLI